MSSLRDAPRFDPLDPEILADPYPAYRRLRQAGPLARGGPGTWLVTRHRDVSELLTDPSLASRLPEELSSGISLFGDGPSGQLSGRMLSALDGHDHTVVRRAVHEFVGPRTIQRHRPNVVGAITEVLEPLVERGRFDAVEDLAFPVQAVALCAALGIPRHRRQEIWPAAMELGRNFIPYRIPSPEQMVNANEITLRLRELVRSEWEHAEADTVLGRLKELADSGAVPEETAVDNAVFLFFSGFETTMNVVCSMAALLPQHPAEWDRLKADPSLVPTAINEFLRYDSPAQYTIRLTSVPTRIGDQTIRAGRMLLLLLGSANRDEKAFERPDELDVARHPNPHVSFGGGRHHCVGWPLGLLITKETLSFLLHRCAGIGHSGPLVRLPSANFRAFASIPVVLN